MPAPKTFTRSWIAALALAAGPLLAQASTGGEVAGYVLIADGQWLLRGSDRPLVVGAAVPPGAVVAARSPAAGDRLVVVAARSGAVLLSHQCASAEACRQPVAMRGAGGGAKAVLGELMNAVMARLEGEPDRYVATLTRGRRLLGDGVLPLQDGVVNLAPVLGTAPAGTWDVALTRLDCGDRPGCAESLPGSRISWTPGAAAPLSFADGEPGLYEVMLRRPGSVRADPDARGWILVASAADHASKSEQYAAAVRVAQGWGAAVDAAGRQSFLRAWLDELARR